ncbi:MAG: SpoIIE family protein phosphatase [Planctomycetes bacterium]|nr:SpoIIE family protein phosphatase [Planctomycetota bacterium]
MPEHTTELRRARTVQEAMLPAAPRIAGLEIAASYRACDHIGGDFYDFVVVDPGRLGIVMADVSGHGTAAALVMAAAKKALQIYSRGCASPREALLAANDNLLKEIPRGMFVSVFYGVLELATRRFSFVRAGHNPLYLMRAEKLQALRPDGTVLGVMASSALGQSLQEEEVVLATGDAVIIYTDGLTEAMNAQRAMFGEARVAANLQETLGLSAEAMIAGLRGAADSFRAGAPRNDDEAIIVLRMLESPADPPQLDSGEQAGPVGNLPAGTARLIGRDRELNEVLLLISGESRGVSITGAAGIGKTRLALGAASLAQGVFQAGIWHVDMAEATDLESICSRTAKALGVDLSGGNALERIGHALQGRTRTRNGRMLLVLDNCDGCRAALVGALDRWRAMATDVAFLVTSRSALGSGGESVYALRPLALPPRKQTARIGAVDDATARKLSETPAVALFVNRARERAPGFQLTVENADAIGQLCVRLDGIPLALELAAARAKVLTPQQMLQRLSQRFALLRDQRADARQSTLEGAIAWSWDLLNEAERDTLAQLSVCRGGFFLELAEEVVDLSAHPAAPLCMDIVESLHDKSLLEAHEIAALGGERRFSMYESIRAFASGQLAHRSQPDAPAQRWRKALVASARRAWDSRDHGRSDEKRARLQIELEGLTEITRAGTDEEAVWAGLMAGAIYTRLGAVKSALAILERLHEFVEPGELRDRVVVNLAMAKVYSDPTEAEALLRSVSPGSSQHGEALLALGHSYQNRGNGPKMAAVMDEIAALPNKSPRMEAQVLAGRGNACVMTGDLDEAMKYYADALVKAEKLDEGMLMGQITGNIGVVHNIRGERALAVEQFNRALSLMQTQGHQLAESYWLVNLGIVLLQTGNPVESEKHLKRALLLGRENGLREVEATTLATLSDIEDLRGNLKLAIELSEQACEIDQEVGNVRSLSAHLSTLLQLKFKAGQREGYTQGLRRTVELCESVGDRAGMADQLHRLGAAIGQEAHADGDNAKLDEAIETLRRSIRVYAEMGSQRRLDSEAALAECLHWRGEEAQALELAQWIVQQTPQGINDNEAIARAHKLLGR